MTAAISLSAARADNFYNPPDWDPSKISRDKYQNSKGSNQYEQRGEIRFEMPFNVWCISCNSHIGRGVRYNALKTHVGMYFSTKLWEFTMKCHLCKGIIKIQTDPKMNDYKLVAGVRKQYKTSRKTQYTNAHKLQAKIESNIDDDNIINDVKNDLHEQMMENDAIYKLENQEVDKRRKIANVTRISRLKDISERNRNDFDNNCMLRGIFRKKKKRMKKLKSIADEIGLNFDLLPVSKKDCEIARYAMKHRIQKSREHRITAYRSSEQSIFDKCGKRFNKKKNSRKRNIEEISNYNGWKILKKRKRIKNGLLRKNGLSLKSSLYHQRITKHQRKILLSQKMVKCNRRSSYLSSNKSYLNNITLFKK